jgi:PTH1 family peptidyl-tRNA hydrolase
MSYVIVGLGNPGIEYERTRHNTGRILVERFGKNSNFSLWAKEKKTKALESFGVVGKEKITLILPQTFMNKSGISVKTLITSKKKAEKLVVLYDDLDLPLGKFKISFARGSGGHKGVESITKSIGTKDFLRIRVGITPSTPRGKLKKPKGEKEVLNFIMGKFTKKEMDKLKLVSKKINQALLCIIEEGREKSMNKFN